MRGTSAFLMSRAIRSFLLGTSLIVAGCGSTEPAADRSVGTIPDGWGVVTSPASQLFTFGLDRSEKHGGQQSAFVSGHAPPPVSTFYFYQMIRADNYRGKRVRWSGWIRTVGLSDGGGGLWFTIVYPAANGGGDRLIRAETTGFPGTTEWHQMSVVLDVPSNAVGFNMGVSIMGPGELWVDDFQLEEVGAGVPTTGLAEDRDAPGASQSYAPRGLVPENLGFEGL